MAKIDVELANGAKAGSTLQELTKEASKLNKEISKLPIGYRIRRFYSEVKTAAASQWKYQ
jgi:hypothetical protein